MIVDISGVLVVDKPVGPTSHDVVSWARRALGTRAVGHAGTLDPLASGVLVLGVGEGTKLTPYLAAEDKEYLTTVALGAETRSLDAGTEVLERAEVPPLSRVAVERAAEAFIGTYLQRAPVVSAIKREGVPLHVRARRGEDVEAPEREVTCTAIEVLAVHETAIDLRVECGKGFYVRSLGRDLARALGTRGHLSRLRRSRSGRFRVENALDGELLSRARREPDPEEGGSLRSLVRTRLLCLEDGISGLPRMELDTGEARAISHGRLVMREHAPPGPLAAIGPEGRLVAIVEHASGALRVLRGFQR